MFKKVLKYVNILLVISAGPALITKQKAIILSLHTGESECWLDLFFNFIDISNTKQNTVLII